MSMSGWHNLILYFPSSSYELEGHILNLILGSRQLSYSFPLASPAGYFSVYLFNHGDSNISLRDQVPVCVHDTCSDSHSCLIVPAGQCCCEMRMDHRSDLRTFRLFNSLAQMKICICDMSQLLRAAACHCGVMKGAST